MHKDIIYSITGLKLLKTYQSLIRNHIQSIKQQSTVFACYFLTSLLKIAQLITLSKDKQSNSFSVEGPVRQKRLEH